MVAGLLRCPPTATFAIVKAGALLGDGTVVGPDHRACADLRSASQCRCTAMVGYRQVQVIAATSGASGVTIRGLGMFSEFGGAVHGSTHTPGSSRS